MIKNTRWLHVLGLVLIGIMFLALAGTASADDEYEENDDKDTAAEVNYGNYSGLSAEDDDWYKISLKDGADITVTIRFNGGEADLDLYLYNEDDEELDSSEGTGNTEEVEAANVDGGWYYIEVSLVNGTTSYDMMISDEAEEPVDSEDINVDQQITDGDDDDTLNDCTFYANIKREGLTDVQVTIFDQFNNQVDQGTTDDSGIWESKDLSNRDYHWTAEYDGETLEDEGTFDVAVGVREVQGFAQIRNEDLDTNYNDAYFVAYDNASGNVEGVECELSYADNGSLYAQGKTDSNGQYRAYNLPEENFTFTTTYDGDEYNTGWLHSYGRASGGGDTDEWFEDWDYKTRDTGTDRRDDTIDISYDPDTEAVEMDIEVYVDVYLDDEWYDSFWETYTIYGEDEDWFTQNWTADQEGYYDFEVILYDDDYYEEDYFWIEDVHLYAAQGMEKTTLEGYITEEDSRGEGDPIYDAEVVITGNNTYRDYTDENGYYKIECEQDNYTIEIKHKDYQKHEDDIWVKPGKNWYNASLTPKERGRFYGKVTDKETGDPMEDVRVRLRRKDDGKEYTNDTESNGSFSMVVEAGEYDIVVHQTDYEDIEDEVEIEKDDEIERDYELEKQIREGEVWGTVKDDAANEGIEGVTLTFEKKDSRGDTYDTSTDGYGDYDIDLPEGDYDVTIEHDDYKTIYTEVTVVGDGSVEKNYRMDPKDGKIYGEVTDKGTEGPIKDAVITAEEKESRGDPYTNETTTDRDGEYEMNLPPGEYTITVEHEDYIKLWDNITIAKEDEKELDYELEARPKKGTVYGMISDKDGGAAMEGAEVTLESTGGRGETYSDTTDADGEYSLTVPAGDYTLTVKFDGYEDIDDTVTVEDKEEVEKNYEMEKLPDKKLQIDTDAPDAMEAGDEVRITITVTEETSSDPVEGADIDISHTGPADLAVSPGATDTDAKGEYSFLVTADEVDVESELTIDITAEKDDHQSKTHQLTITINPSTKKVVGPEEGDLNNGASYSVTAGIEGDGELSIGASLNSPDPEDDKHIGLFVDIEFDGEDDDLEWVYIVIYYDWVPDGLSENELKIYYWDDDAEEWMEAEETGVDTVNQFVWANVTHLSLFAPRDVTGSFVRNYGVDIEDDEERTVKPGQEITVSFTIENTGEATDNYQIEVQSTDDNFKRNQDFSSTLDKTVTPDLEVGETFTVTMTFAVEEGTPAGTYTATIRAESMSSDDAVDTVTFTVTVQSDGSSGGGDGGDDDSPGFALGILVASLGIIAIRRKRR